MNNKTEVEREAAEKAVMASVTQLTDVVAKHVFNFKFKRADGIDTSDPNKITDFEDLGKGPGNNFTKEEYAIYDKTVVANRYMKRLIANYIYASLSPFINMTKKDFYKLFS